MRTESVSGAAARWVSVALLVVGLAGCATTPAAPAQSYQPVPEPISQSTAVAGGVLSVIGTPVFALLKAAVCAASVVVATPLAAVSALAESHAAVQARQEFREGVGINCGPPYHLSFSNAE